MAHFVELDENNVVIRGIVVNNSELMDNGIESESKGIEFCENLLGGRWIQTSYNRSFRKNYAGEGYTYDQERDAFIPPKQYNSWVLDEELCVWEPPIPFPNDGKRYKWNEDIQNWTELVL